MLEVIEKLLMVLPVFKGRGSGVGSSLLHVTGIGIRKYFLIMGPLGPRNKRCFCFKCTKALLANPFQNFLSKIWCPPPKEWVTHQLQGRGMLAGLTQEGINQNPLAHSWNTSWAVSKKMKTNPVVQPTHCSNKMIQIYASVLDASLKKGLLIGFWFWFCPPDWGWLRDYRMCALWAS